MRTGVRTGSQIPHVFRTGIPPSKVWYFTGMTKAKKRTTLIVDSALWDRLVRSAAGDARSANAQAGVLLAEALNARGAK